MIECSAEPSILSGFNESPQYLINTNLLGTINCLEALRQYKADIIFLLIGDVRAESACHLMSNMRVTGYAKVSKIRCPWSVAPCNGSGH
jgi:dTDP-D-glucose 4,6-dehydratase